MKLLLFAGGVLSFLIGGCSIHQPAWKSNARKIVATSVDQFEREGRRLCPFGYDVVGEHKVFVEGRENTRYIRCRKD